MVVLTSSAKELSSCNQCTCEKVFRSVNDDFEFVISNTTSPVLRLAKTWQHEIGNRKRFKTTLETEQPDIVYFWNLTHVSMALPSIANSADIPNCCFVFDHSWTTTSNDPWSRFTNSTNWLKRSLSRATEFVWKLKGLGSDGSRPGLYQVPTDFLGSQLEHCRINPDNIVKVNWGVDTKLFRPTENTETTNESRILFVGQIARHKGVHILIDAFWRLAELHDHVSLTIVGAASDQEYMSTLENMLESRGLTNRVEFHQFVERARLPEVYRNHDILVFPSVWEEPMGIVPMEAMSCGLAVFSSGRGGSKEVIEDTVDGYLFDGDAPEELTKLLSDVVKNKDELVQVRQAARAKAQAYFDFEKTVEVIESQLCELTDS